MRAGYEGPARVHSCGIESKFILQTEGSPGFHFTSLYDAKLFDVVDLFFQQLITDC